MKKTIIAAAMAVLLVVSGSSWAYQITVNRIEGYYYERGGEFNITGFPGTNSLGYASTAIVNGGFESFCLEYNEIVNMGYQYNAVISPTNTTTTDDTISQGTAYLYSQFAQGTLSGYNYTAGAGRIGSAAALQNTIWWLEGEITTRPNTTFLTLVENRFGTTGAYTNYNPGLFNYGVGVLNITTLVTNENRQDQLIYTSVPEPATLLLLGLGLIGLAGLRRMRKA